MLFLFSLSQNSPATLIALCYQIVRPKMVVTTKMLLLDQENHQHSSRDMFCVECVSTAISSGVGISKVPELHLLQ